MEGLILAACTLQYLSTDTVYLSTGGSCWKLLVCYCRFELQMHAISWALSRHLGRLEWELGKTE